MHKGSVFSLHPGQSYLNSLERWTGRGDFTLEAIRRVLSHLDNPQDQIPSIHVGGTNGKGSISAMLAAILRRNGARVGLSTSPHLERVNERISIDGKPVSDKLLFDSAVKLRLAAEHRRVKLTYHEALTALGFMIFAAESLDWIVIEVGLGGKLDASNVLKKPRLIVISSIGRDHEAILGPEITSIAAEKAGIIKDDSALVLGDMPLHALEVIEMRTKGRAFGRDFNAEYLDDQRIVFRSNSNLKELQIGHPGLWGEYQLSNIGVAIESARNLGIEDKYIAEGIESVDWPGRLERLNYKSTPVILDGAHNIDAISALILHCKHNNINKLRLVFGVLGSKRWQQMIEQLIPFVQSWYLVEPESEMAVPCHELAAHLSCFEVKSRSFGRNVDAALNAASSTGELFLICGSLYLVGQARALIVSSDLHTNSVGRNDLSA